MTAADLIARLEAVTEGNRELDKAIGLDVVGFDPNMLPTQWPDIGSPPSPWPPYTTSLDAALTLVPAIWRVYNIKEAYIYPPNKWFACLERRREHRESMIGKAPTPALALCIAALKARNIT